MLTALQHYNIWHIFICCLCKINHPTSWGLKLTCYFSQFHGFRGWLLCWSCLESVGLLPWGDSWTGRTSQEDFSRWRPWGLPSPPRGLSFSPSKVRLSNQETRSTPGARGWKPQNARAPPDSRGGASAHPLVKARRAGVLDSDWEEIDSTGGEE